MTLLENSSGGHDSYTTSISFIPLECLVPSDSIGAMRFGSYSKLLCVVIDAVALKSNICMLFMDIQQLERSTRDAVCNIVILSLR